MADETRTPEQLLRWVEVLVAREQARGTFGKIEIHMQDGKIERVTISATELPPRHSIPAAS